VPQARWGAGEALRLVEEQRISSLYLAPTLFHDLVHHPSLTSADVGSVRALGYAGAAMTSTLVRRCADVFSPEVFVNHYGSTEVYTFSIGRDQLETPTRGRSAKAGTTRATRGTWTGTGISGSTAGSTT
jgi:2-furoate---CoA ligase